MIIKTNVKHCVSIVSLGADDMGADDCESNLLSISNW